MSDVPEYTHVSVNDALKSNGGETPLHWAAARGDGEVVDLLLENGAYVSIKTYRGETPLHFVARGGCADATGRMEMDPVGSGLLG